MKHANRMVARTRFRALSEARQALAKAIANGGTSQRSYRRFRQFIKALFRGQTHAVPKFTDTGVSSQSLRQTQQNQTQQCLAAEKNSLKSQTTKFKATTYRSLSLRVMARAMTVQSLSKLFSHNLFRELQADNRALSTRGSGWALPSLLASQQRQCPAELMGPISGLIKYREESLCVSKMKPWNFLFRNQHITWP